MLKDFKKTSAIPYSQMVLMAQNLQFWDNAITPKFQRQIGLLQMEFTSWAIAQNQYVPNKDATIH